ncbi:hypothetical protein ASPVEDRAFT_84458 [Aspergillus versicolor CBS 583.65]|uniref:NAD-dependent epimerase/dehydratase domain-containing protein n=1 Tax=Aspergillus versicolor CBS 583.65 TaxID=1036611 RepID=A0A1L9PN92_ASPVE|nr:uncharacterized protein ASPVEDRAFT_84458 [Aspergillus versicolor CBS 583.65]OJJ02990.1 hypothetical protein ASPVEDRAFT_84458 [Aspergillus versicolor CBS 583.65]
MLILVAGITGFVGVPCARAALARGHKVRGLARDVNRVPDDVRDQLEGFETLSGIYDIDAMDGPAAERAGVKVFHASSWNYDWRLSPGTHEIYDDIRAFAHHAEVSSSIRPIYMFTGAIADYYFFKSPSDWDTETKTFSFHGPSTFCTRYTTAEDIGNYVLEAVTAPDAANGGYIFVQSFEASPEDIIKTYNTTKEGRVTAKLNCLGTLADAKAKLDNGRANYGKKEWYKYIWYCYQYHIPSRSWDYEPVDVARFPSVKQSSLEQFFRQHPAI